MPFETRSGSEDDGGFLSEFEAAAIPPERWSHREHVRVAFLYLRDHPLPDALALLRSGIRALNRANRVVESTTSGYHETVTVAWTRLIASAIHHHGPAGDFESFARTHPHLLSKSLIRVFYTKERILTEEAKARFVEPDLAALPAEPSAKAPSTPPLRD